MAQIVSPSRSNIPPYGTPNYATCLGEQRVTVSKRYNYLFIALKSCIYVHVPAYPSQTCPTAPAYILRSDPIVPVTGYIDLRNPHAINSLTVGDLGFEEVLVSAHDDGDVCVWYTRDLSRIALRLSVSVSAWGVALHKEKRLLAVSANSHNITVFQLGIGEDEQRAKKSREEDEENYFEGGRQFERKKRRRGHEAPMDSGVRTYANVAASGLDGGRRRAPATPSPPTQENISSPYKRMVKTLKGHETNIPSISFLDDPSGRWLVSTSIDGVVVVWDIEAEKMVEKTKLGHLDKGWSVMFLKPEYFKPVATIWEALGYPVPKASSQGGPDVERMKHGANRCAYSISPVFLKDTTYMPFEAFAMRQEYEDRQADSGSEGEGDEDQEIDWIRDDSSSSSSDPGYYAGPGGYVPHLDWEITIDTGERTPLEGLELGDEEVEIEDAIEGGSAHETISPAPSSQEAEEDTFVPVGQGTEQPETPISPGTWERWVIGEWERHARDQRDLSNRLVRRRAQASVKPRAPSVPLENGDEAEPPPLSFIFSTTDRNCTLLDTSGLSPLVVCRNVLHSPALPGHFQYLGNIDRLNMVCCIPELSIVVAASQKGKAAVFRLTRFGNDHLMRLDYILPKETSGAIGCGGDDNQHRPTSALLGMAAGPIQGREFGRSRRNSNDYSSSGSPWETTTSVPTHAGGTYYRVGRKRSGWRGVEKQRRYRLMMVYADGTVLSYELGKDPNGGSLLQDGFLMV